MFVFSSIAQITLINHVALEIIIAALRSFAQTGRRYAVHGAAMGTHHMHGVTHAYPPLVPKTTDMPTGQTPHRIAKGRAHIEARPAKRYGFPVSPIRLHCN